MLLRRYHNVKKLPKQENKPLTELTIKELRDLCKERGIKGYSNKSENELIEMLTGGVEDVGADK